MVTAEIDSYLETSAQYVGRWVHLVSTTNWEKGRIIQQWRKSLQDNGAPAAEYGDEAWARRVGGVSSQHVGRLRRVADRFGEVFEQYAGLYWSHFHAALEWDDAEMWLEGAVQNEWSVKQVMKQRAVTLGGDPNAEPSDEDVISSELDEDVDPQVEAEGTVSAAMSTVQDTETAAEESEDESDDEGDDEEAPWEEEGETGPEAAKNSAPQIRPFESLPSLPEDVQDAMEAFKLCIVRHKLCDWEEISRDGIIACLDALRTLAMTPAE